MLHIISVGYWLEEVRARKYGEQNSREWAITDCNLQYSRTKCHVANEAFSSQLACIARNKATYRRLFASWFHGSLRPPRAFSLFKPLPWIINSLAATWPGMILYSTPKNSSYRTIWDSRVCWLYREIGYIGTVLPVLPDLGQQFLLAIWGNSLYRDWLYRGLSVVTF